MDKKLSNMLQTPAIAQLITELDKLGYELYIKPKPLRYKTAAIELNKQLQKSLKKESK